MRLFDRDFVIDSAPCSLVELLYMIQHRPDIKSQIENGLAKLNSHRKGTNICQHKRHSSDRELSFAIYVGLLLYAKTR